METYPRYTSAEHPGKYDVLKRIYIERADGLVLESGEITFETTLNDLAVTAGDEGRDPRTAGATIFGDESTNGMECIVIMPVDPTYEECIKGETPINIELNSSECSSQCGFWGQCPLQEQLVPPIREKANVKIEPRSIGIEVLGNAAEIPDTLHEELYDLIMRGNLGRFEIATDQYVSKHMPISRNLVLEHPEFRGTQFVVAMGKVAVQNEGQIEVSLPDEKKKIDEIYPKMGTTFIVDGRPTLRVNKTPVGAYTIERLLSKVNGTIAVNKLLGEKYELPHIVSWGKYANEPKYNNLGWLVYSRPAGVKLMSEWQSDILNRAGNMIDLTKSYNAETMDYVVKELGSKFGALMEFLITPMVDLHKRNLVHNQWHPSNIGITKKLVPYIFDFETLQETSEVLPKALEVGYALTRFMDVITFSFISGNLLLWDELRANEVDSSRMAQVINLFHNQRKPNLVEDMINLSGGILDNFVDIYWDEEIDKKNRVKDRIQLILRQQAEAYCYNLKGKPQEILKQIKIYMADITGRVAGAMVEFAEVGDINNGIWRLQLLNVRKETRNGNDKQKLDRKKQKAKRKQGRK